MIVLHKSDILGLLSRHGFRFSHKLGQNFIFDEGLITRIADAAQLEPGSTVVEVGPGAGTLTRELAVRVGADGNSGVDGNNNTDGSSDSDGSSGADGNSGGDERSGARGRVIAVEIDSALIPVLREILSDTTVEVVHGDILKTDLSEFNLGPFDVVANLPYYITTPVIMRFLESDLPVKSLTVMVQREVAERIEAAPGTKAYGALSIAVQYRCTVEKALSVPAGAFTPRPKVDSRVIRLAVRESPAVTPKDEKLFFAAVKAAFAMRRKTLANNLCAYFSLQRETAETILEKSSIAKNVRGETLSLADFARLSDALLEVRHNN